MVEEGEAVILRRSGGGWQRRTMWACWARRRTRRRDELCQQLKSVSNQSLCPSQQHPGSLTGQLSNGSGAWTAFEQMQRRQQKQRLSER